MRNRSILQSHPLHLVVGKNVQSLHLCLLDDVSDFRLNFVSDFRLLSLYLALMLFSLRFLFRLLLLLFGLCLFALLFLYFGQCLVHLHPELDQSVIHANTLV